MRAAWTASGAPTTGSIAPRRAATRRASGGAATTSTANDRRVDVPRRRWRPCLRRPRQRGRRRRRRLARPRGRADLRRHGAAHRCFRWWSAGSLLFSPARCIVAERNGPDVPADERLPFGALAEADRPPAPRCKLIRHGGIGRYRGQRNPATLVTPTARGPASIYLAIPNIPRRKTMTTHNTGTRKEWLAARLELLQAEKELTRQSDALAQRRQELPWVRIDKAYRFDTDQGKASLADLFGGRSQLLVYHFMFGPDYKAGCPSCSMIADGFEGFAVHLANHDVALWAVSRAPLEKLQAYKRRMGWSFPWASSEDGAFNFDFNVSFTEEEQRKGAIEYNYARRSHAMDMTPAPEPVSRFAASCGTDAATYSRERPGMSAFVREGGEIYHSYSTYARGLDGLWGAYQWLDRAPKGRNETGIWWRRHDEYEKR